MFDNGSKPKWSTKIHIVKAIKAHSVLLDNDKWYKYYQVMKVNVTEQKTRKRIKRITRNKEKY